MSQDAKGPRHETVEGFEDSRQQSKQGKLGRGRPPCWYEDTEVCAGHEGCGLKLELEPNGVIELPVQIVPHNARTAGRKDESGLVSSLSELGQIEGMMITIANSEYVRCLKRAIQ